MEEGISRNKADWIPICLCNILCLYYQAIRISLKCPGNVRRRGPWSWLRFWRVFDFYLAGFLAKTCLFLAGHAHQILIKTTFAYLTGNILVHIAVGGPLRIPSACAATKSNFLIFFLKQAWDPAKMAWYWQLYAY